MIVFLLRFINIPLPDFLAGGDEGEGVKVKKTKFYS
jgi:hypothetical protein